MKHTGMRMRSRRNQMGMSVADLAARISLSKATVHRYENGDIENIKMPVLSAIARELGVNVAWLLGKSSVVDRGPAGVGFDTIEGVFDAVVGHMHTAGVKCCGKTMEECDKEFVSDVLGATLRLMAARYR